MSKASLKEQNKCWCSKRLKFQALKTILSKGFSDFADRPIKKVRGSFLESWLKCDNYVTKLLESEAYNSINKKMSNFY